jgi:ParB family chromosome partitioning protein
MMKMKRKVEMWPVAKLREHDRQAEVFCDLKPHEFEALVEDIRERGLQEPIEILPDGTIIAGHQRWWAVQELGHKEVSVVIRHDLADDPQAAEAHFLLSNLARRQLDPISQGLCVVQLSVLKFGASPRDLEWSMKEDAKKWVAQRIGKSPRHVDRLLRVLETPPAVQTALRYGLIDLPLAGQVAGLDATAQDQLATAIEHVYTDAALTSKQQRQRICQLVKQHVTIEDEPSPADTLQSFVDAFKSVIRALEVDGLTHDPNVVKRHRPVLKRAAAVIAALLESQTPRPATA